VVFPVEAGYQCERCKTQVEGGTGSVSHPHRFDYCRCTVAIRSPDSEWNPILIEPESWEQLCIGAIGMAQQATNPRFRKRPEGPNISDPPTK
jgi:hypothetical protein